MCVSFVTAFSSCKVKLIAAAARIVIAKIIFLLEQKSTIYSKEVVLSNYRTGNLFNGFIRPIKLTQYELDDDDDDKNYDMKILAICFYVSEKEV